MTAINYGMKINVQKTKTMVVRWNGGRVVNITVNGKRIEQVKSFKYLGSIITEDGRSDHHHHHHQRFTSFFPHKSAGLTSPTNKTNEIGLN